jgi:hypothetical protein
MTFFCKNECLLHSMHYHFQNINKLSSIMYLFKRELSAGCSSCYRAKGDGMSTYGTDCRFSEALLMYVSQRT